MSDITKHKRENGEESKRTKFMRKNRNPNVIAPRCCLKGSASKLGFDKLFTLKKKALSLVKENWEFYKLYRRIEDDDHRRIKNDHRKQGIGLGDTY